MKRFVVTGCNGYIGSHMCYELKRAYPGCYIIGIDQIKKLSLSSNLVDRFIRACLGESDIGWIEHVDCVFHFAASASVPEGEARPYAYYKNNLKSTMDIMDMAIIAKAEAFVFSSTCAVYGDKSLSKAPLSENEMRLGKSVYAKTKMICEDVIKAQDILPVSILRYFNVAGRNQIAGLREDHDPETHLIPILHQNDKIKVFGTDYPTEDGSAVRDYIHVIDVCRAHIAAYEYMVKSGLNLTCNIGTGKGYSVLELVKLYSEIYDKKYTVEYCEKRAGDSAYLVADNTRMKNFLKFEPQYDIVDIIKSMK